MEDVLQDCRYALRRLRQSPFFVLFVVVTLSVGIAATTVMFGIADGVLFRRLPYPDPDRLVWISQGVPGYPQGGATFSYPAYRDISEQSTAFETVAGYQGWGSLVMTVRGEPIRMVLNCVTPSYLTLLGAHTQLGRLMRPEEDRFGAGDAVVVISHAFWQRQLGGDPSVVGSTIHLSDKPFLVVGVTAADFRDAPNEEEHREQVDAWIPLGRAYEMTGVANPADRAGTSVWAIGRLKAGFTLKHAREDLAAISQRLATTYPQTDIGYTLVPRPLKGYLLGALFSPTRILLVASFCLLLIACANVASLLLARLLSRRRELAVRAALGASAQRLARYLLIENAVLTLLAGGVGFVLADRGIEVLRAWATLHLPSVVHIQSGARVFLVSLAVSLVTGVFFGVAPALLSSRVNIEKTLRQGGRQGQGLVRHRGQKVLVVAEVSLALVVLMAAGMLVESFRRLASTPMGFDTSNLLTLRLELPLSHYADDAARGRFTQQLNEKLQGLPNVKSATLWGPSMLGRARTAYIGYPEGASADDANARLLMDRHAVHPGALANLGIPMLRGRDISWQDDAESTPVAVISQGVADKLWPGKDPIGKRMRSASGSFLSWVTVIGVARDSRQAQRFDLNEAGMGIAPSGLGAQYDAYFSCLQRPNSKLMVALRVSSDVAAVSRELRDAVLSIDPTLPVFDVAMLDDRLAAQLVPCRLTAVLSSAYAGLALFLAAFGLFAVLGHEVSQRLHEMGVRMALGAQRHDVLRLVLREGVALTAAGLLVGMFIGTEVSHTIKGFLFGVSPSDPAVCATISAVLIFVALLACWIPAHRATRVDPIAILRGE
jgi:putative ABC transport system permease protein